MAFYGFKKQINKANQYMSEKMGAAEGTKFTAEYLEMEKKTDAIAIFVDDVVNRTKEFLQPNPATRAKFMTSAKIPQTPRGRPYVQPEGLLGDCMVKVGRRFDEDSLFARSLVEIGEAFRQLNDVKFALEDDIKQKFIEPLIVLQSKELRDIAHHRKKLESRRLDFDCKKRRKLGKTAANDEEIKMAGEKLEESFNSASQGMHNLLQNESDRIAQLTDLSQALSDYYSQCATIFTNLTERLNEKKRKASERPLAPYVAKKIDELQIQSLNMNENEQQSTQQQQDGGNSNGAQSNRPYSNTDKSATFLINASPPKSNDSSPEKPQTLQAETGGESLRSNNGSPLPSPVRSPAPSPVPSAPCCRALYDFEPENENELAFNEGDIITLKDQPDENWLTGEINGRSGIFPISYVQVLVPLPT